MSIKDSLSKIFLQIHDREPIRQYDLYGVNVEVRRSDKKKVENLLKALSSIPTGQQAIDDLKKHETVLLFDSGLDAKGGFFKDQNRIKLNDKGLTPDEMKFVLVHEARHLSQWKHGRKEIESQKLDYATRLMINRATEADADTQALKACKEWEAMGDTGPLKKFAECRETMVAAYNKCASLSDAFKGWFDREATTSAYEHSYDTMPYMSMIGRPIEGDYVSLKPADIKNFCGADRVEGFENFMESKQARQVHLLTKTMVELCDEAHSASGMPHDPSLKDIPLKDLKENHEARLCAATYIKKARESFGYKLFEEESDPLVKNAIDCVEKMNAAAIEGKHDSDAEKGLKNVKENIRAHFTPAPVKKKTPRDKSVKTSQIIAIRNGNGR